MTEEQFQVILDLLKMIEYNTSIVRLKIEKEASPYYISPDDEKEPFI